MLERVYEISLCESVFNMQHHNTNIKHQINKKKTLINLDQEQSYDIRNVFRRI